MTMRKFIFSMAVFLTFTIAAQAKDMSHTEDFDQAYRTNDDDSLTYQGKCSLHDEYENKFFRSSKVIQKYIRVQSLPPSKVKKIVAKIAPELWETVLKASDAYEIIGKDTTIEKALNIYMDDIAIDEIQSSAFPKLNLIRFNIGVGGGNGMFLVFNIAKTGKYQLMSKTMDRDIEYCDSKVWLK